MNIEEETKSLTTGIYSSLIYEHSQLRELESENEGDEMLIKSGKYTGDGISEIQEEIRSRTRRIEEAKAKLETTLNSKIDGFVSTCTPVLNPAEITDDAKLLTCGVTLKADELEALMERNKGNFTMETILLRYAEEHSIDSVDLRTKYQKSFILNDIKSIANGERERIKYALKYLGKPNGKDVINRFYGV